MRALLLALAAPVLWASSPAVWEMTSYADFVKGRFSGISLTRDGRLTLAPKMDALFATSQPVVWSVARGADGAVYAATGHKGRVFRIDASGNGTLLWTADQPEVFAIAVDAAGDVYAATSPDGKIYRIRNGKATEHFAPGAKYIWALAFGPDGALYAATGDQGKIYRISAAGKGEVWYETAQVHVTALAFDARGRLLAGSEPNGILYRIEGKDKAFVLYDASLPEIRSIIPAADGSIYVAALGGSLTARSGAAASAAAGGQSAPQVTSTTTSITVTDAQTAIDIKPRGEAKPSVQGQPQVQASVVTDIAGVEKSALYRIQTDNTVETLWSSKEENIYDIALDGASLYLATDQQGRVYKLSADRKTTLLTQLGESETMRLMQTGTALIAATANMGKLYRLSSGTAASGWLESPVHDAGSVARWGRLRWKAETVAGAKVKFRTRSGNSLRPDKTWSDWSAPLEGMESAPIASPNARYIQWRAEMSGTANATPLLDTVAIAYLPQNTPPQVKSITVTTQLTATAAQAATQQQQTVASYSITVTDTGDAGGGASAGTPTQALGRAAAAQTKVAWQAEDTDGDKLIYSVWFRGEDEREWKLVKNDITDTSLLIDGDALADGRYFFRVVASDRLSNAGDAARTAELVGSPVLIDNTPPVVKLGTPRQVGVGFEVEADADDAASSLRRAEYSVDAGPWTSLASQDGVIDSRSEHFTVRIATLAPGEHLLVVRVSDSAGNTGLAKTIIRN